MTEIESYSDAQQQDDSNIFTYLPSIAWQRRWWIVVPLVLGSIGGIASAFLIPARYESRATLLVESPQLPSDIVGNGKGYANVIDKRIAKIRQQVLSRPDLIELIENNNLYSEERQTKPLSTLIERMRTATSISAVDADIGGGAGGQGSDTIAFNLSYTYPDPQKAQIVAQDFVERLVKLDASQSSQQTAGAVDYLQDQATSLSTQISSIERQIQGLKAANGSALSSSGTLMLQGGSSGAAEAQIAALQRENAQLAAQAGQQSSAATRDPAVVSAEAQLAAMRATYSDDHPDIKLAQRRLVEAKQFAAQNVRQSTVLPTIQAQIAANRATMAQLSSIRSTEQSRSSAIAAAQSRAPLVTEQVSQLEARADGLRVNYQVVSTNLMNARGAAKLETQQKGERLSVIDPPVVADEPSWPNRPLLILGGIFGGGALGLGLALLMEMVLRPVRGVGAVQKITGHRPLVTVPIFATKSRGSWLPWRRRRATRSRLQPAE